MPTSYEPTWLGQLLAFCGFLSKNHSYLSSFVEACFGINTLLGVYADLRLRWVTRIEVHIGGVVAKLKTLEINGNPEILTIMIDSVEAIQAGHSIWQERMCVWARNLSLAFAIGCLFVLFFDGFAYWNIILALPFPAFFFGSYLSSKLCEFRINRRAAVDKVALTRFKLVQSEVPVSTILNEKIVQIPTSHVPNGQFVSAPQTSNSKKKKPK